MHPNYSKVFYKQEVSAEKIREIMRSFSQQGLTNATTSLDPFGRVQLGGSYENEKEVELAFSIARSVVGDVAVSDVRPQHIKQKDWEISASKGFANFIDELAKKYNMSVRVEQSGDSHLIGVADTGSDGIGQFASGSGIPTQNAAAFYKSTAAIIVGGPSEKNKSKRMLIVGHTDDTGSTKFNVELSEQRAHAVGKIFEEAGIAGDLIYYQGAGEYYPIADNGTDEGRTKNRRVEIVDLGDEKTFRLYLIDRHPNTNFYRSVEQPSRKSLPTIKEAKTTSTVGSPTNKNVGGKDVKNTISALPKVDKKAETPTISTKPTKIMQDVGFIDFGGSPYVTNISVNIGSLDKTASIFNVFNEVNASSDLILSCNLDRPRNVGQVKSLKSNKTYKQNEYLPTLADSSWVGNANGHLVALSHVAVLRDGVVPASNPELMVFKDYNGNKDAKPFHKEVAEVNIYHGDKGLLYRVFGDGPVRCMDIVITNNTPKEAPGSAVFYDRGNTLYSTPIKVKRI